MKVVRFASAADFRRWLLENHTSASELWVGFYRKNSAKVGLTYPEAVDEALCFGWIDGIVRKIDADSFTHRFTPRRTGSIWSNINVRHIARLTKAGKMHAAGVKAFAARQHHRTGVYSYEQSQPQPRPQKFPAAFEKVFRANPPAWRFWQTLPPGYQRTVIHWVTRAKQDATRLSRLTRLVVASAAQRRI